MAFAPSMAGKIADKALGAVGSELSNKEMMRMRKEVSMVTRQTIGTQKLIKSNMDVVKELSKSNTEANNLLTAYTETQSDYMKDIESRIMSGEKVSSREMKKIMESQKKFLTSVSESNMEFSSSFEDITSGFKDIIGNLDADKDERRQALEEFISIAKVEGFRESASKQQLDALNTLVGLSKESLNFTSEQNDTVTKAMDSFDTGYMTLIDSYKKTIMDSSNTKKDRKEAIKKLSELLKSDDIKSKLSSQQLEASQELLGINKRTFRFTDSQEGFLEQIFLKMESGDIRQFKMKGSLDELNKSMDTLVATDKELADTLEKQTESGESVGDILAKSGLSDIGKTIKGGIIDMLLSKVGLGGLGVGDFIAGLGLGGILKKIKVIPTKIVGYFKSMGAFFGRVMGVFKSIAGPISKVFKVIGNVARLGKVIPVVGQVIAAVMSVFDAVSGWFNASDITGKSEETLTLFDKFKAAVASLLSGLTLNFVSSKDIYAGIEKTMEFLFGDDGIFTKVWEFGKNIMKYSVEKVSKGLSYLVDSMKWLFNVAGETLASPTKAFGKLSDMVEKVKQDLIASVVEGWNVIIAGTKDLVLTLWEKVKSLLLSAVDSVMGVEDLASKAKNSIGGIFGFGGNKDNKGSTAEASGNTSKLEQVKARLSGSTNLNTDKGVESIIKSDKKQVAAMANLANNAGKPVVTPVIIPTGGKTSGGVDKSTHIDDYGIAFTNSLVFGG